MEFGDEFLSAEFIWRKIGRHDFCRAEFFGQAGARPSRLLLAIHYSPLAVRYSPFTIRFLFGSSGASPSQRFAD